MNEKRRSWENVARDNRNLLFIKARVGKALALTGLALPNWACGALF